MVFGIGELPKEYNARVHGPYNPGRYYGPDQRNWKDMKVKDFPKFLLTRSKNPIDWVRSIGRSWWRYNMKWQSVRYGTFAPYLQIIAMYATFCYFGRYDEHQSHRQSKYH